MYHADLRPDHFMSSELRRWARQKPTSGGISMDLNFPITLRQGKELIVVGPQFLKWWKVSFLRPNSLVCMASKSKRGGKRLKWIVEANGLFRELEFVGIRREWARPLAFLWNFMQEEYRVGSARRITVTEFQAKIDGIADRFLEAPHGTDLREYLRSLPQDAPVTAEIMKVYLESEADQESK